MIPVEKGKKVKMNYQVGWLWNLQLQKEVVSSQAVKKGAAL